MSLLKQITKTSLLISYEQVYIQSYCYLKGLVREQNTGEHNPMYQLIFDPPPLPHITSPSALYTDQYPDTQPIS
jgi:hypothetical protein